MAPEHENEFGLQEPIRHIWIAERHSKSAELHLNGLWPNDIWVIIKHNIFDFFAERYVRIQTLIVHTYSLKISCLYK